MKHFPKNAAGSLVSEIKPVHMHLADYATNSAPSLATGTTKDMREAIAEQEYEVCSDCTTPFPQIETNIEYAQSGICIARVALALSHAFDFGNFDYVKEAWSKAKSLTDDGLIGVPFDETLLIASVGFEWGRATLAFVVDAPGGRIEGARIFAFQLVASKRRLAFRLLAVTGLRRVDGVLRAMITAPSEEPMAVYVTTAVCTLLMMLADNRVGVQRHDAPPKVNAARVKRGKPPLASFWRADGAAASNLYVTTLTGKPAGATGKVRGGGGATHRSPIAHDRRGHPRRLASGNTIWVRPSRVGEISKHLARGRSHYEAHCPDAATDVRS